MNKELIVIGGVCFAASLFAGIWPRHIVEKARRLRYTKGDDPNKSFGFKDVQETDRNLYRQLLVASAISLLLIISWAVMMFIGLSFGD